MYLCVLNFPNPWCEGFADLSVYSQRAASHFVDTSNILSLECQVGAYGSGSADFNQYIMQMGYQASLLLIINDSM